VRSRTTAKFRKAFAELPPAIQEQARTAYRQFKQNPWHPSLRFKPIHTSLPIYSARVSKGYRAVGQRDEQGIVWFWIGSHADYDHLLSQLQ
jgi:hypothetical protein